MDLFECTVSSRLEAITLWSALLILFYLAFQLVPSPLLLLRILDPTRFEIANALLSVLPDHRFSAISIVPDQTFLHFLRICGYVLVFLIVREHSGRLPIHLWWLVLPYSRSEHSRPQSV